MPNWADENGRYWYNPPGKHWWESVEIPHPPVVMRPKCKCAFCTDERERRRYARAQRKAERQRKGRKTNMGDSRPLTDIEKRDLSKVGVWAMDVEMDGGTVPAEIDELLAQPSVTPQEARTLLRWFYSTAPGNF